MNLVIYEGDDEVLICTKKDEKKMVRLYFGKNMGRDKEEYDRSEMNTSIFRIEQRNRLYIEGC